MENGQENAETEAPLTPEKSIIPTAESGKEQAWEELRRKFIQAPIVGKSLAAQAHRLGIRKNAMMRRAVKDGWLEARKVYWREINQGVLEAQQDATVRVRVKALAKVNRLIDRVTEALSDDVATMKVKDLKDLVELQERLAGDTSHVIAPRDGEEVLDEQILTIKRAFRTRGNALNQVVETGQRRLGIAAEIASEQTPDDGVSPPRPNFGIRIEEAPEHEG